MDPRPFIIYFLNILLNIFLLRLLYSFHALHSCPPAYFHTPSYHIVAPGDEVGPPLDVGDGALALVQDAGLPAAQPVPLIQEQL